ncbi:MAG: tetratricopeptide repeat protein [Lentisphaerae bacterium]|jgi:tetratricopeptide (TPR) repeat protein|nr:tetratricopeptide repeat protein [Lentisphaerota bacterium]MBT4816731.1 tetratricopeptide repeat protein [Lentisphaerota bacterium]MBT5611691.1 tetratricopeptide repeat protein [Lentisphaerota bacterium]MBT7059946.1 tetratricopeptide repeat protein [Lentisphaerota bacterium]MBT7845709.1 tetratricopeptide repeat protein [Lentisphaerota bacterium]
MRDAFLKTCCALLLLAGPAPLAGPAEALAVRAVASQLVKEGRLEEAIACYERAANATADLQNNASFLKAASEIALRRLRDPDRALALAEKIKGQGHSQSRQLVLLVNGRHFAEAIAQFGDAEIQSWPHTCHLESFLARGTAYGELKRPADAKEDLERAVASSGAVIDRGWACKRLGDLYQDEMNDHDRALAVYRKGLAVTKGNYAWRNRCLLSIVAILVERRELDTAAEEFKAIEYSDLPSDYWRALFYISHAGVLREQRNNGQAATQLVKILRLAEVPDSIRENARVMLDALIEDMGGTTEKR